MSLGFDHGMDDRVGCKSLVRVRGNSLVASTSRLELSQCVAGGSAEGFSFVEASTQL